MKGLTKFVLPLVLLALVVVGLFTFLQGPKGKTLTAEFPRAVSIYQGSDVRVLGVPVGKIDSVTPSGTHVIVKMHYDANVKIPASAKAVIVSPSIVGDRFVQLTPAYTGGPVLASGTTLSEQRTAVPLELDQIYSSIDDLTVALGPNGANKKGALTDLLDTTAANFGGQGKKFHQTILDFSRLSATLSDNKTQLFGSLRQLEGFVHTLAKNDKTVRSFNTSLARVSHFLKGERGDLAASLDNLAVAMRQVSSFVKDNRAILGKNIRGLNQITGILVKQRSALEETLRDAPLALNNLALTYNPQAGTLDTRANIGELLNQLQTDPTTLLCSILDQADTSGTACNQIIKLLGNNPLGSGGGSSPLGKNRAGALGGSHRSSSPDVSDPTLGGLAGSAR